MSSAAFFSSVEFFLVNKPAFAWVCPWWGAIPVSSLFKFSSSWQHFIATIGILNQAAFIGTFFVMDAVMLALFTGLLKWK